MSWIALLARYWKPLAITAAILLAYTYGHNSGSDAARTRCEAVANKALAESAVAEAAAIERYRAQERDSAERINRLAEAYETARRNDEESHANDLARLNTGADRLREHWRSCTATGRVSGVAASAALADAAEQLRRADTADLIGIGREADTKDRALRAVIEADRK